jgi:large subunit ribosomal protein L32
MPVPKRKRSRARRDSRFANKGMKAKAFTLCGQCNQPLMPHTACRKCGYYKGSKVMSTKLDRLEKRTTVRRTIAERRKARSAPAETMTEPSE